MPTFVVTTQDVHESAQGIGTIVLLGLAAVVLGVIGPTLLNTILLWPILRWWLATKQRKSFGVSIGLLVVVSLLSVAAAYTVYTHGNGTVISHDPFSMDDSHYTPIAAGVASGMLMLVVARGIFSSRQWRDGGREYLSGVLTRFILGSWLGVGAVSLVRGVLMSYDATPRPVAGWTVLVMGIPTATAVWVLWRCRRSGGAAAAGVGVAGIAFENGIVRINERKFLASAIVATRKASKVAARSVRPVGVFCLGLLLIVGILLGVNDQLALGISCAIAGVLCGVVLSGALTTHELIVVTAAGESVVLIDSDKRIVDQAENIILSSISDAANRA